MATRLRSPPETPRMVVPLPTSELETWVRPSPNTICATLACDNKRQVKAVVISHIWYGF
jgi:hypothetical protein